MFLNNETATLELGRRIASLVEDNLVIYLSGDLGSGKTCFARGFIQGLGHEGRVKSPTYTIVEPYLLEHHHVYHLDLYRLSDPQELEFLGIRDMSEMDAILLIEWPERGHRVLPAADLEICVAHPDDTEQGGRNAEIKACSPSGNKLLGQLTDSG